MFLFLCSLSLALPFLLYKAFEWIKSERKEREKERKSVGSLRRNKKLTSLPFPPPPSHPPHSPPSQPKKKVCRRWKAVLDAPEARPFLWREVVVDFGHELITAVHTPIAWSDARPSDAEFRDAFAATRLAAARVLDFVAARARSVRRVVLTNSEGYWSDEGDFVNLQQKHTFSPGHVGLLLGSVRSTLEELQVSHCSDIFSGFDRGALGMVACCPRLRVLRIDDVHTRLERDALAQLGRLTELEELAVSVEDNLGSWAVGLDAVPEAWRNLKKLKKLELRGHVQLASLPRWLPELEALEELDLSGCCHLNLASGASAAGGGGGSVLQRCLALRVVSLSGMRLTDPLPPPPPPSPPAAAALQMEVIASAALFGQVNNGGNNNVNSTNPAMQPRALAAAVEAANAAAAAEAAQLRVGFETAAGNAAAAAGLGVAGAGNNDRAAALRAAINRTRAALAAADGAMTAGGGGRWDARALAAGGMGFGAAAGQARRAAAAADDDDDDDDEMEEAFAAAVAAAAAPRANNAAVEAAIRAAATAAARTAARNAATAAASARALPDLSSLPLLEALNLSDNALTRLPYFLPKLGRSLRFLDLSGNGALRFPAPLVPGVLSSLPALRALDARGAHAEAGLGYWSEDKCATMRNLCALARAGKRRRPWRLQVFMDKE